MFFLKLRVAIDFILIFCHVVGVKTNNQEVSLISYNSHEERRNHRVLNETHINQLEKTRTDQWKDLLDLGANSYNNVIRLEKNLLNSLITVNNGTISHAQLLDSLPNNIAHENNIVARKILICSLYVYNTQCINHGISGKKCALFLSKTKLPDNSQLFEECQDILKKKEDKQDAFRRLLPQKYMDGFYEMFSENILPPARELSRKVLPNSDSSFQRDKPDDALRNLAIVQWAQFIEHDLSKPVVTLMSNGNPIECCQSNNLKLQPRFRHPACAPLLLKEEKRRESCLNYVRSSLALSKNCTFGRAEQLNQASGSLDLSQLYGTTQETNQNIRLFRNGQLKFSNENDESTLFQKLLPRIHENITNLCALVPEIERSCFIAGDSRVNSNPLTIAIYTIFMRNHNQIATKLRVVYPHWSDDALFNNSKSLNIFMYQKIVIEEWLPAILAPHMITKIKNSIKNGKATKLRYSTNQYQISNEFGVAAMRFYWSMMPNSVQYSSTNWIDVHESDKNFSTDTNIFLMKDQFYKSTVFYSSTKVNAILESVLNQPAMKMDAAYVDSVVPSSFHDTKEMQADFLAQDIQRGRDHGLEGYTKYLEMCHNIKVKSWNDLEPFICIKDIELLRSTYRNWSDIDLIVGGVLERASNQSLIGPTFSCILVEQFTKIEEMNKVFQNDLPDVFLLQSIRAVDILCTNSDLRLVPKNIFYLNSKRNPLEPCAENSYGSRV